MAGPIFGTEMSLMVRDATGKKKSMASHVKRKGKEEEASVLSLTAGFESGEEEKWEETQVGMKEAMPSG